MENKGTNGTFVVGKVFINAPKEEGKKTTVKILDKNSEASYAMHQEILNGWIPKEGETVQAVYNPGEFNGKPSHWVTHLQPTVQPVEPTREPTEDKPDWDAKDLRMARMSALKTATEIVVALNSFQDNETARKLVVDNAEYFTNWIYEGRKDGIR